MLKQNLGIIPSIPEQAVLNSVISDVEEGILTKDYALNGACANAGKVLCVFLGHIIENPEENAIEKCMTLLESYLSGVLKKG